MMNPPVISNSGSLEDCHTNFFALTDLCGIRWRKFVFVDPTNEPLKDPILRSYARCLRENILCVWRRISSKKVDSFNPSNLYDARTQNSMTFPPLSLKTSKELWIFWYGEEPDLNELLVPELMKPTVETAEGSYENGISYECRSLLFKALHNLIERCLLSRGVMRLGKWFVQPCTRQNCSIENGYHHMSFSFGFFVHGESTVCTSIDLRNHPNVRRLTLDHVKEAALNSDFNQHPVILAPYGLAGTLTGKYYKPSDPITKKTLKEWSIFYPLLRKTEYHYPPVVEVITGGVRMCYPAKYVLVTDIDDEEFAFSSIPKMCQQDDMNEIENENKIQTPFGVENIIGERVWQECVIGSQILTTHQQEAENVIENTTDKEQYFEHPTSKSVCNCTIRKNPDKPSSCGLNQSNQLMADISSAITSMGTPQGTPSSPELSPYFPYPSSVSPPEYESQALPIPSPNQLSSQYELQNFLNSSSDYDDTHSPFVLTSEQPQNNQLTPNPSPDSIIDKVNANEQISPGGSVKESGKSISDDEIKEKILHMKTDPDKNLGLPTSDTAAIDNANITNALDISIKSEHLSTDIDLLENNTLNDTNFLNSALENIFGEGESELNENETKMSFESNDQNKKSENEHKNVKNLNESSDSDSDDTDDDSDDSDDSDDDESTENSENEEEEDDASDVEQKKHSPNKNNDGKSKKNTSENDIDENTAKQCTNPSESLEKILSADADSSSDSAKMGGEHEKGAGGEGSHQSPKSSDKLGCMGEKTDGSRTFGMQRSEDSNRIDNLPNDSNIVSSDLANDNHSNISDSDVGDFADDVDDSSNDSAKSSNSHDFVIRLTNKSSDVPIKSDCANLEGNTKSDIKTSNSDQMPFINSMNFLDDLNTTDTSDSNSSGKDLKCSSTFSLMRDCGSKGIDSSSGQREHDDQLKTSPSSDTKLKGVSSCIGLSLDSAIGSKSVEDDNAMSDLHTDNISDDEYDIKPDSITSRKAENISIRSNENFESIANYINPTAISLNTLISADYSNLSDNNDTNSNDNRDNSDNKRNENSPTISKSETITDKDIMEPGELLGKNLLESQDSNLTSESVIGDVASKIGKSPFPTECINKDKSDVSANCDGNDGDAGKKSDGFCADELAGAKGEFGSLNAISTNESGGGGVSEGTKNVLQEKCETAQKTDDEMVFSFLDEQSMQDSNQSGILDILINDPIKSKDDTGLGQMLPKTSTSMSGLDLDSESLSQIMESIKSPNQTESERKRTNSPGNGANTENTRGDDRFNKTNTPYISPVREHMNVAHCIDNVAAPAIDKHSLGLDDSKSIDGGVAFVDGVRLKDSLTTIDLLKNRPSDLTREIEIKIENPTEFLPEQITQSSTHEDIDVMSSALSIEKKSSTLKTSGESAKKLKNSESDANASKLTSSSSSRSSKSSKKSKHAKSVESSKKSSKSSNKTDKNKSTDTDNTKNSENAPSGSANTSSSSKKAKDGSSTSRKRILKPTKRPHRTFYSNSMQIAKRNMINLETLASLMKRPNLNVRNHDLIAECNETPQSLYDFSTWEAWMAHSFSLFGAIVPPGNMHPVKRFKPGERFSSRAIFKELQDLYSKQNVRLADFKNNPPNSVESKSVSDGLHTSDEDVDQDYYNDSGSNSNLSDYDLNSPDILCSPTNFSDIYFGGARNLSLLSDLGGMVDPDCSDNSNEGSMQDWTFNLSSSSTSTTSKQLISSKYAPLTNIAPTQAYLQHNFIYRPSWESSNGSGKSLNKKNKFGATLNNKVGIGFSKSKNKNKHRTFGAGPIITKTDGSKSKRSISGFDYLIKKEVDFKGGQNKYESRHMTIKEEPTSDTEIRNESESDTDSDTDKKKSGKKKSDKGQKSRKSGQAEECSMYDNNGNSDDNSNDSGHNFDSMKSDLYHKSNIKSEVSGSNENVLQRGDAGAQRTNSTNLDKSSSSVEEFDNEKPVKVVKVHINLDYDSEVYNEEVHIRKFHKYQRNIEMANSLQVAPFDTTTESFPFENNATTILESGQQMNYSSSDSDSDDSDGNDLDDSDNSSCDECATGPCSTSILPSLQIGSTASSPAMSLSSYYNKNETYLENIAQPVQRLPETNALILNLLLYDTSLNVFRDHNFNSCSLCVCHTSCDGTFGNIRGLDSGRYLALNGHSYSEYVPDISLTLNPIGQFETENDRNMRVKNSHLLGYLDTDPIHCTCGYSAIVNRRLSHKSGLFYDDENEITGIAEDPQEQKAREKRSLLIKSAAGSDEFLFGMEKMCGSISQVIMDYIQEQCTCVQNATNSVQRSIRFVNNASYYSFEDAFINVVEYCDAQDIIRLALDNSKLESQPKSRKNNALVKSNDSYTNVHKWPYIKASVPSNNKDVLKFMQMLMPVLQGSFNKKYMTRMWEAPYAIQGPLTWRQFHRLASTQSGQCEPQPIPSIIVGHEKEWLSVSPFAIQYWDQLMLEPYSYTRDVAYIVVTPDNDYVVDEAKQFFKELSTMYEMCKLGRHCPIKGCDGILRSSKSPTDIISDEFENLYALFEDNKTIEIIKSYIYTCQQHLVPYLTNISSDKSILDPEPEGFNIKDVYKDKSMSSPMFQPDTPEFSYSNAENKEQNSSFENECDSNASYSNAQTPQPASSNEPIVLTNQNEANDAIPPCIIIYVLNPLSFGHESEDLQRISCIALLRSYSKILNAVPDSIRNNIKLQILSMESILEMGQNCDLLRAADQMRCLALSIFSQCRRNLTHDLTAKVLTGFGTAANLKKVIQNKDQNNRTPYKLYAPPYILSGRDETIESSEVFGASTVDTPSSVLYCNYCLSEDQKWLLAVATDERGELLETITINIEVVNSEQNPKNRGDSIRRQSLQKLMDFIIGIISQTSQQWRIVIGRVGRIGHGELKAWSWLLCKSSLVKISKQLKDVCDQCSMMYLHSCPSIVSACLLTLEPDTCFRILSDQFTPDERFSQIAMQSTLSTPSDLSCTHILVLPINAAAQAVQTYPEHHITDFSEEELFVSLGNSAPLGGINNMASINNMGSLNGMNSINNINGIGGLNNINGMNMNSGMNMNMNNAGMNALNALNNMNNINNLAGVNNINGLSGLNGIDSMNGIDNLNGIDSMDGIEGIDLNMDGMDDVNMNNIEDFLSNDWENHFTDEIQLPTDNPQDDPTLDVKLENVNPNDDHQLLNQKVEMAQVSKQDHDQKPNANLMLSVNMSGLGHQVKLESDCDTGNMQMQLHNTSDEFGQMMAQPLAIGFMVSTAPINRMPPWFWVNCPQLENVNPVFLKSSLHIHSPLIHQNSNEYINQRFSHAGIHPLDSPYTADTMRYILESYNFLSWLAIDPNTNDRISCLPAHIQVLMQLYNMIAAFT